MLLIFIIVSVTLITLLFGILHDPATKYKKIKIAFRDKRKKVLVVDDDPEILNIVKNILITHDFDVKTHATGLNVPEIVTDFNPNVVLLDIRLPGKSGTQVCKELKENDNSLPVIFFSARAEQEKSFASCKANDFIQKPFNVSNLINTVKFYAN